MKLFRKKDVAIFLAIVFIPILFYTYRLIPADLESFNLGFFVVDNLGHESMIIGIWVLYTKLLISSFLLLWYFTCKHWWKNAILIPLIIEFFKILSLFGSSDYYDENELFFSSPLTIIITVVVIIISRQLYFYARAKDLKSKINFEIDELLDDLSLKNNKKIENLKSEYFQIKQQKNKIEDSAYFHHLLKIRRELTDDML